MPIAKVFLARLIFPPIVFPMSKSFTPTENHENLAADAAQWEAERAMMADAAREQAREEGAEAMAEARRDAVRDWEAGWGNFSAR